MTENEIRELLISYLSKKHLDEENIAFIKEIFIDNFKCRVDLVLANGCAVAFEIKSALDTLIRLPTQLESLVNHFDEIVVVCAQKHLNHVLDMVDDSIGVLLIKEDGCFRIIKKAKRRKITKEQWLSHLPVDELKKFLREHSLPRNGDRELLVNMALKGSLSDIRLYVIEYFKRREKRILAIKEKKRLVTLNQPFNDADEDVRKFLASIDTSNHLRAIPRQIHR